MFRKKAIFYGWWIVLACALAQALGTATSIYLYGIFATELGIEFDAGRGEIMIGLTGMMLFSALISPKIGSAMDRFSVKRIMIFGALIMGAGYFLISFSVAVWNIFALYFFLISIGFASLGLLSSPVLLSRWFVRHRGLSIGLAALGSQLGGFAMPPVIAYLIEAFDWRIAMRILGFFVALSGFLLAYFIIYERPEDRGLSPDGDQSDLIAKPDGEFPPNPDLSDEKNYHISEILCNRNFWLSAYSVSLLTGTFVMILANLAFFAADAGVDRNGAALLISVYAACGMVASPIVGRLCDVLDVRRILFILVIFSISSLSLYMFADGYTAILLATVLIAIPGSSVMAFTGALVGSLFDSRQYAKVFGCVSLFTMASAALAPVLAGFVFDLAGHYRYLFMVAIALLSLALFSVYFIKLKPVFRASVFV